MKRTALLKFLAAVAAAVSFGAAHAAWPERPITLIVPFPPGGGLDLTARVIAPLLQKELGQSVIVVNRAGATGSIGADAVAKSPADGYTLLWGSLTSHAIYSALYAKQVPYDLEKNFTPVTVFGTIPLAFVLNPSVKAKNLSELIALAKSKPGSLTYATSGNGSVQHLAGEMFQRMAGVQMLHVPYKGIGPAMLDLIAGQVNFSIESVAATLSYINSGKLRALAVASGQRVPMAPDVPTTAEAGLKGFEVGAKLFVAAPAGTPAPIIAALSGAMKSILENRADIKEALQAQAVVAAYTTPAEAAQLVRKELDMWTKVIQDAKIKPE
ncbi:MAG: tripartite tricarboxylate transporter substrate binding protein [Pseudomonadota bacterium]